MAIWNVRHHQLGKSYLEPMDSILFHKNNRDVFSCLPLCLSVILSSQELGLQLGGILTPIFVQNLLVTREFRNVFFPRITLMFRIRHCWEMLLELPHLQARYGLNVKGVIFRYLHHLVAKLIRHSMQLSIIMKHLLPKLERNTHFSLVSGNRQLQK